MYMAMLLIKCILHCSLNIYNVNMVFRKIYRYEMSIFSVNKLGYRTDKKKGDRRSLFLNKMKNIQNLD